MKLVQLVYYSKGTSVPEKLNSNLKSIIQTAATANAELGVSGLLLFSNEYFLQVLEGPRIHVNNLYFKIQKDPRHKDSQMLLYRDVTRRDFSDWSMGWASESIEKTDIYFKYCATRTFAPEDLTGEAGIGLLKEIAVVTKALSKQLATP